MLAGFFTSKAFVVSAVIAALLLGAAAGAYYTFDADSFGSESACSAPALRGAPVAAAPTDARDGRTRTVRYALDAAAYQAGALDLCLGVGELLVEPSNASQVEVVFTIRGATSAIDETQVEAAFRADDGRLVIGAWQSRIGRSGDAFGTRSAEVTLLVRVPVDAAYRLHAVSYVGDVRVGALRLDALDASADVGDVIVRDVELQGNATLRADVGDAILAATSVQSGTLRLTSEVGNVEAALPLRADVGYDATATASVGEAVVRLGEGASTTSEEDGPGQTATGRSGGYAEKPTKVIVNARADVGDARIVAS